MLSDGISINYYIISLLHVQIGIKYKITKIIFDQIDRQSEIIYGDENSYMMLFIKDYNICIDNNSSHLVDLRL